MPPLIRCHKCEGCGRVKLGAVLFRTLRVVILANGWITATDVARRLHWPSTKLPAINNRLAKLHRLHLIERERKPMRRNVKYRATIYSH